MADSHGNDGCLAALEAMGLCASKEECRKLLCEADRCYDLPYLRQICTCQKPYLNGCAPNPYPGCCAYGPSSPIAVINPEGGVCYCCCGGNASGQWNAVDADESRPVAAFVEGDTVYVADDGSLRKWSERPVAFKGAAATPRGVQVSIRFRRGEGEESLVAHREQPFMLADRTLRRAGGLVPGVDSLVERDGTPLPVLAVDEAPEGEAHHLATSRAPATSVDGHLVLVNGVVAGDYALQLADIDAINARALAAV